MSTGKSSTRKAQGFTDDEKSAMKERARELKAEARAEMDRSEGESAVQAKIAEMTGLDHTMAARIHAIIKDNAPVLSPKLWYGMPAYAMDGKIVCFFQPAQKFNTRYATLGFNDSAKIDEGSMWPVAYALEGNHPHRRGKDCRAGEESGRLKAAAPRGHFRLHLRCRQAFSVAWSWRRQVALSRPAHKRVTPAFRCHAEKKPCKCNLRGEIG